MRMREPGARLEAFLARLYSEEALYQRFLAGAEDAARAEGLTDAEIASVAAIDRVGLGLARESYARKRRGKAAHARRSLLDRAIAWATQR